MSAHGRSGIVRLHLEEAAEALARRDTRAARMAVRPLRSYDFEDQVAAERWFRVVRDLRSTDDELLQAVLGLIGLAPCK